MNKKIFYIIIMLLVTVIGCLSHNNQVSSSNSNNVNPFVYPGSNEVSSLNNMVVQGLINQYSEAHTYKVKGISIENLINWYKNKFSDYEQKESRININNEQAYILSLKKGNVERVIIAFKEDNNVFYTIAKNVKSEDTSTLPEEDLVSGEEPISRYPESIMLSYKKTENGYPIKYTIEYGTVDNKSKVVNWYINKMQSNGWSHSQDDLKIKDIFLKDKMECAISVIQGEEYNTIHVECNDFTQPNKDLKTGYEPLERYPHSTIIGYKDKHLDDPSSKGIEVNIDYISSDRYEEVWNWYINMLKARFGKLSYVEKGLIETGERYNQGNAVNDTYVKIEMWIDKVNNTWVNVDYINTLDIIN